MSNKHKIVLSVVLALVVVFFGAKYFGVKSVAVGAAPQNCSGSTTCFTGVAANNVYATDAMWIGSDTASTSERTIVTAGQCNVASTTLFSVANPFSATATVSMIISGVGQASSSNLTVGTTTNLLTSGFTQNNLSGYLAYNLGPAIATTSQFFIRSGVLSNLGTGQAPAGTSTAAIASSLLVGANEYVGAFSTSTYPISGAAVAGIGNYVPGLTCTYKLRWIQ